jgi:polyphosphate kinase 2 (PPK2 family)
LLGTNGVLAISLLWAIRRTKNQSTAAKAKKQTNPNSFKPVSDALMDELDRNHSNSAASSELQGGGLEHSHHNGERLKKKLYESELEKLQSQLVKMQYWIKEKGFRMIILFEGRDAAGKGGTIKRLTEPLNPRGARVVALGTPSDRQKTQWYFQRYVEHFPAAGEIVVFDRSWYNRAGVERVMGFCTPHEVESFLEDCPQFERMLVRQWCLVIKVLVLS